MNNFNELFPSIETTSSKEDFTPLHQQKHINPLEFKELHSVGIDTILTDNELVDTGKYSQAEINTIVTNEPFLKEELKLSDILDDKEIDYQSTWDDGYASGATDSGIIEANKFAKQLTEQKKQYKRALESVAFNTSDIRLSDNIIEMFKTYCNTVCLKVFGDAVSSDLTKFISDKVAQFEEEIRSNDCLIKIYVSSGNFEKLKSVADETGVGDVIELSVGRTIHPSSSMTNDDTCKVVAMVGGETVKADLNLLAVHEEGDLLLSHLLDTTDVNEVAFGDKEAVSGNVLISTSKTALLERMNSSLGNIDLGDLGDLGVLSNDINLGKGI